MIKSHSLLSLLTKHDNQGKETIIQTLTSCGCIKKSRAARGSPLGITTCPSRTANISPASLNDNVDGGTTLNNTGSISSETDRGTVSSSGALPTPSNHRRTSNTTTCFDFQLDPSIDLILFFLQYVHTPWMSMVAYDINSRRTLIHMLSIRTHSIHGAIYS